MYTTPAQTMAQSVNTSSSSSAPLMTKNRANSGEVHLSAAPIRSPDRGQRLQNTVPSIMHTSKEEKPTVTGPSRNSSMDRETVRNTKAMVTFRRLVLEWNSFSSCVSSQPMTAPSARDPTISTSGFTRMDTRSISLLTRVLAMPKDTANTTRPTASSRATMGSSRLVKGPLALYWRTTISVAAGAVAVAMAPRVSTWARDSFSGIRKWSASRARSTSAVAVSAWKTPMTAACLPVAFRSCRRNSLPMEKAMNPRATSEIRLRLPTA